MTPVVLGCPQSRSPDLGEALVSWVWGGRGSQGKSEAGLGSPGLPFPCTSGPCSPWLRAAPGARPPLSGALPPRPRLSHRQEGPRPLASLRPPAAALTSRAKGGRRRRGGCPQGTPSTSWDEARSRGDGSAPGAIGTGVGRSRHGQRPAKITSNRPKGLALPGPALPDPARFTPNFTKTRRGSSSGGKGLRAARHQHRAAALPARRRRRVPWATGPRTLLRI